jgi:hypothetical protein
MALFSDSVPRMGELISKSKKVRRGATLEEAEIDDSWLTTYATIARRCHDDKYLGVSRYPYELPPGLNPLAGGFFEHRQWAIRRGMERHSSLRPLYEAHYTNTPGYWTSFSVAATALRGEVLRTEGAEGNEAATRFDVWAMLDVQYGLRVVDLRTEF